MNAIWAGFMTLALAATIVGFGVFVSAMAICCIRKALNKCPDSGCFCS